MKTREGMIMRTIKSAMLMFVVIAAALFAHAGFAATDALNIKAKDGIGSYLVDGKGMTLYLFKKDTPGTSACGAANGCLEKWPVYFAETIEPAAGVDTAGIGVITRADGMKQNTYKGAPLYYFFKDKAPGDTLGQGVNNVWYVVAP
jgi:predicted lipoprotein with Yx(FWY)xxD motif